MTLCNSSHKGKMYVLAIELLLSAVKQLFVMLHLFRTALCYIAVPCQTEVFLPSCAIYCCLNISADSQYRLN